jgi:hypothetical protein
LSLAKSSKVVKCKHRRRTAERLLNFPQTRNAALWRKRIEIVTFLLIAAGQVGLLSDWLMGVIWAFPHSFTTPLRITQEISNSLWEFPSSFPIHFQQCQAAVQ